MRKEKKKEKAVLKVADRGKTVWKKNNYSQDQRRICRIKSLADQTDKMRMQRIVLALVVLGYLQERERNKHWKAMEFCCTHMELYHSLIKTPETIAFIALNVSLNSFCPVTPLIPVPYTLWAIKSHSSIECGSLSAGEHCSFLLCYLCS